jgi:beta-glucosidase
MISGATTQPLLGQATVSTKPLQTTESADIRFANSLLKQMTLVEKLGQMSQIAMNTGDRNGIEDRIRSGQVGSLLFITNPAEINQLQKVAVEQSRLHIPLLIASMLCMASAR